MNHRLVCTFIVFATIHQLSIGQNPARAEPGVLFGKDNLVAWCIVPFDAAERDPVERAEMLDSLGISRLAYDYREKHIPTFREEIEVLDHHGIELTAVWFWVNPQPGDVLSHSNRVIMDILEEAGAETELWVSFPDAVFEGLEEDERMEKAVHALEVIHRWAAKNGCTIALYNHGGWFGNPVNQVRILEAIGSERIGIVYNFHHGHHQIDRFPELLELMLPYLTTININGMDPEGPKILPVGEGTHEKQMLRAIVNSGYTGPIGILGHTRGRDIRPVLERNIEGLSSLTSP